MDQRIEPLGPDDLERVEAQRTWVRNHYEPGAQSQYDTIEGKLRVISIILRENWIRPDETVKLQCLGITYGDALAQKLGLTWIAVEDEYGRDPALIAEGTSIRIFPLTSISKRVERGETVDVYELFENACATIDRLRRQEAS